MAKQVFWYPGDRRSMRRDRVPLDMRVLGRLVPHQPAAATQTRAEWTSIHSLDNAIPVAFRFIQERLGEPTPLELTYGHYPEVARLPFGGNQRELLTPGCYIITDTSPWQRILYAGSSCDGTVRHRLISHLFCDGRLYLAQQAFRNLIAGWQSRGYPEAEDVDAEIRRAIYGENRWAKDNQGAKASTRSDAVELVRQGAFDISLVSVAKQHNFVARCIEHFVLEFVRAESGELPPLNAIPVQYDYRRHPPAHSYGRANQLFDEMAALAKSLGAGARSPQVAQ